MARKNLLSNITATLNQENLAPEIKPSDARLEYTKRGASRSMMQSLDDLAETSLRMLDGETVVSIDPADLDGSFIADRIGENDEEYQTLREAIRLSGQSTPILVRPHPDDTKRYMIVFGHRRAKVARDLGVNVRAVIKPLADIEHVIAQGQENTARADLSFIEKALFSRKLLQSGMSKEIVKAALTVDDTLLSRMLSVADVVPDDVLEALGAAKGVGRDRWEELKKTVLNPSIATRAQEIVKTADFRLSEEPFSFILNALRQQDKKGRNKTPSTSRANVWATDDKSVSVASKATPKSMTMEFSNSKGKAFGEWISSRLNGLYDEFNKSNTTETGE